VEIHGHLAVGVHGEVRVLLEKRPRPIRSVRYRFMEVGIDLYKQVAVFDGPDVFRIAISKVRRVGRTSPVEGNGYSLADCDVVRVHRPGFLEESEVEYLVPGAGNRVELVSQERLVGESLREG